MGTQKNYPMPKPRKVLPVRSATLLVIFDEKSELLLERRPPAGIWGGLWSLPELPPGASTESWSSERHLAIHASRTHAAFRHTFSHFHLDITPLELRVCVQPTHSIMEPAGLVWYKPPSIEQLGLPAPVRRLLEQLNPVNEEPLNDPHGELRQAR
jgi:A/G-specific adenine glycosylase